MWSAERFCWQAARFQRIKIKQNSAESNDSALAFIKLHICSNLPMHAFVFVVISVIWAAASFSTEKICHIILIELHITAIAVCILIVLVKFTALAVALVLVSVF